MFLRLLNKFEESFIALLLVSMTLLVFLDVVMRFGWGSGLLWSQELTLNLSAWFVLFGISYGLKTGAHIGVDAFVKLWSPTVQRLLSLLAVLLCLVYCGFIIFGSWIYLAKMYKIGISVEDMSLPMWFAESISEQTAEFLRIDQEDPLLPLWITQSMLIIGFFLFSIRLLALLVSIIRGKAIGFSHVNEADEGLELAKSLQQGEK